MSKFTALQLEQLNKLELRDLCRNNGIGYNGLNNDGMRAALMSVPGGEDAQELGEALPGTVGDVGVEVAEPGEPAPEPVVEVPVREPRVLPTLVQPPVTVVPPASRKIQPNRLERNGVKHPSEGTICAQIWAWCDAQYDAHGKAAAKDLKAAKPNLDATTCTVQFYRWRKFNGIQGRG